MGAGAGAGHGPPPAGPSLVVVTRAPGEGKTRLARDVGVEACARLQEAFLEDTLRWAGALTPRRVLSVHPPHAAATLAGGAPGWAVFPQVEAGFGARMRGALNAGFAGGAGPVAMIATDSPSLPPERVELAWWAVAPNSEGARADVALAPAEDGGWVLIAAARPLPDGCFAGVRWSGTLTLRDTEAALSRCGLATVRLDPWYDVDTLSDLRRLAAEARGPHAERLAASAAALAGVV